MNDWVIKDLIKRGYFIYKIGDEVSLLKRKSNGHPRSIKDHVTYIIKEVHQDGHLVVWEKSSDDGLGFLQTIRVHKMYMINISMLREIKLNSIL
jgi:hypothetical protein